MSNRDSITSRPDRADARFQTDNTTTTVPRGAESADAGSQPEHTTTTVPKEADTAHCDSPPEGDTYIKVTPGDERYDPGVAVDVLRGLQSVKEVPLSADGILGTLKNKLKGPTYPTFEFLALSTGPDEAVEFFYGVEEAHLDEFERRLREIYPSSFDIERVALAPAKQLVQPLEYDRDAFLSAAAEDALWADVPVSEEELSVGGEEAPGSDPADESPASGAGRGGGRRPASDGGSVFDRVAEEFAGPDAIPSDEPLTTLEGPTLTRNRTVYARPAPETLRPVGLRWHGAGTRKKDWMTQLQRFSEATGVDLDRQLRERPPARRVPLASVVNYLGEAPVPVAFQVVFRHEPDWSVEAESRIEDIRKGEDTRLDRIVAGLFGARLEKADIDELEPHERDRVESIQSNDPKQCFSTTIRAVALGDQPAQAGAAPAEISVGGGGDGDRQQDEASAQSVYEQTVSGMSTLFQDLDGEHYELTPRRFRSDGYRSATKRKHAERAFERFREGEVYEDTGRVRPDLILNPDELASFLAMPSKEDLDVEAARDARAGDSDRNPLPRPDVEKLQPFREGMAIGRALDENTSPEERPLCIPPHHQTRHYARFGTTGSGKSIGTLTDALTAHESTGGPVVLLDRKGDGMCENYCKAHYAAHGNLADVEYLRVPETLPALPLFDIRPALNDGRDRETAIQDKKEHFREILRMVMGDQRYEQAFVANEVIGQLIEALFDEKHGQDAFGLDKLFQAAVEMQQEKRIPPIAWENADLEASLDRHFEKDDTQYYRTMDAVLNRLDVLRQHDHLNEILCNVPEWDPHREEYMDGFDFRQLLGEDTVVIIDVGDLRPESADAISMLLLSNLWDAVVGQRRDQTLPDDRLVNMLIEEAAPLVSTSVVSEQLLPQGRSFGLGLGLIMQFPEQVRDRELGERAYNEVLNNVHTKIIGNINVDDKLAESIATGGMDPTELRNRLNRLPGGEWIVSLPDTGFGETVPPPFSMQSMPIPAGHPESDAPLRGDRRESFYTAFEEVVERTNQKYGVEHSVEDWRLHQRRTAERSEETASDGQRMEPAAEDGDSAAASEYDAGDELVGGGPGPLKAEATDAAEDSGARRDRAHEQAGRDQPVTTQTGTGSELPYRDEDGEIDEDQVFQDFAEDSDEVLTREERELLRELVRAMNRAHDDYSLRDGGMNRLVKDHDVDVEGLLDSDYLEKDTIHRQPYYTVTQEARSIIGESLTHGPTEGDPGEKTPHIVGVEWLRAYLESEYGVETEAYYELDGDVYDVVGLDSGGHVAIVGEVERESNNPGAILDDYEKLAEADARAIWAFEDKEAARQVFDVLTDQGLLGDLQARSLKSLDTARTEIREKGLPGMDTFKTFWELGEEL